ncbi:MULTISPECIES: DUF4124 domain-containing protein [Deefgea]|uniref:DUF4124 domain-containing protein n=1 Tax=Deefgea chitinilytica TaxID=570276 RepID=A0ABS2C8W4_9NEIS|nr:MULTISPECIES: DUF4124 domain-containing protein [Deefgea]MBM5570594.1 DUF4124 domain-containing protein [Deefgea chitinilytica]MBM9887823.1 DUF4124 domain-containing protein [Deefgea sp. CFH1-16]
MMRKLFVLLILSLSTSSFAAKVYQWRDSSGNVFYSDQPPPNAPAKERTIRPNTVSKASETSQQKESTLNTPQVVLWITPQCGIACDEAVALLDSRKILYDVKTADPAKEATMIEFFSVVGTLQQRPPVLVIGKEVIKEWNSAAWHAAISKAGFARPKSNN